MTGTGEKVSRFSVLDERFYTVGGTPHASSDRLVDLEGRTVIPGIIDSHTHFVQYCSDVLAGMDLGGCDDLDEIAHRVMDGAAKMSPTPTDAWLRGGGWDKNVWPGDVFPDRKALDAWVSDRPVALMSRDCHALWVNSRALEISGVDHRTPDPPGGVIARDADGSPKGILLDSAMDLVRAHIPPLRGANLQAALDKGFAQALSLGITGIVACEGAHALHAMARRAVDGQLPLRTWLTIPDDSLGALEALGLCGGIGDDFFRIFAVKVMLDGALGSQTAYVDAGYPGADGIDRGLLLHTTGQLRGIVRRAADLDLPVAIHAIGDAACERALVAVEDEAVRHLRHRIEHAQLLRPDHPDRMTQAGIVASMQPAHLSDDIPLIERHWPGREHRAYAFASLARAGAVLAFGSDVPVAPLDPFLGMRNAAFRMDGHGQPWYPQEAIDMHDALRAYTAGSAWGVAAEESVGAIAPGYFADFVILDRDPLLASSPRDVDASQVVSTWVGGEEVYRREGSGLFDPKGS